MSRHVADLRVCGRTAGTDDGPTSCALLCDRCDGRCPACDSYVAPTLPALLCPACAAQNTLRPACAICTTPLRIATAPGDVAPAPLRALYCRACVLLGRDRDGCPRVLNLGAARTEALFERKRKRPDLSTM